MSEGLRLNICDGAPNVSIPLSTLSPSGVGESKSHVVNFSINDGNAAVKSAKGTSAYWKGASFHERVRSLRQLVNDILKQSRELASLISNEDGINEDEAYSEVMKWVESIELSISEVVAQCGVRGTRSGEDHTSEVRQAIGIAVFAGESALTGKKMSSLCGLWSSCV